MTGQRLDGPQVIEIANDRIVGISAADDSARSLPDIRDLSRFTVLPGLVDSHTHLDFDVLAGLETQQASVDDAELAMRMVNRGIVNIQMGVTTVRLVGSRNFIDLTYRRDVEAGLLRGPAGRHRNTSHPNEPFRTAPQPAYARFGRRYASCDPREHRTRSGPHQDFSQRLCRSSQRFDASYNVARGAFCVRRGKPSVRSRGNGARLWRPERRPVPGSGRRLHRARLFHELAQYARGAELGRWVVPTLGVFLAEPGIPELSHWSAAVRERLLRAREATWKSIALLKASGMNFALSTDANHGGVAYEGIYAAMGGMTNEEALAGLTVHGARLCGKLDEIGVLKPGACADILAIEGDPLQDLDALLEVRCVLKGGVEVYPTIDQSRAKPSGGCPKGAFQEANSESGLAFQNAL